MNMPFTQEQFLEVFSNYNIGVWPMQIIFYLLAIAVLFAVYRNNNYSGKLISAILAFFWLWMGIVYHIVYFSVINKAAILFGSVFIVQAALFIYFGIARDQLTFNNRNDRFANTGKLLIVYALLIYPLLSFLFGHIYPATPTFGLPCPTTIFTFGILLFSAKKIPVIILVIPFLWSLLGFSAALNMGIYEDTGLVVAGLITLFLALRYNSTKKVAVLE